MENHDRYSLEKIISANNIPYALRSSMQRPLTRRQSSLVSYPITNSNYLHILSTQIPSLLSISWPTLPRAISPVFLKYIASSWHPTSMLFHISLFYVWRNRKQLELVGWFFANFPYMKFISNTFISNTVTEANSTLVLTIQQTFYYLYL